MRYAPPLLLALLALPLGAAEPLPLTDAVTPAAQSLGCGQSVTLNLPPLPARAGQVLVLSFRAYVKAAGPGGCNWNAAVAFNDSGLGRFTGTGSERLIGRSPLLELRAGNLAFGVASGETLMVMFARDADQADGMTGDDVGGTFNLDVSDVARGVDGNSLRFTNGFKGPPADGLGALVVQDLRVGYLDRAKLPQVSSQAPPRGATAGGIAVAGLRLAQARGGGFVVGAPGGPELLVETALGMAADTPSALRAEDSPAADSPAPGTAVPALTATAVGETGFSLTAVWPQVSMVRTLQIRDGLVHWRETWTNTGSATLGVPLRHRLFLRTGGARFHVGGSLDNASLASSAANPTLFLEPSQGLGAGYGITAESDEWRLLHALRALGHVGEIYTTCLALAPGKSLDLETTITPVAAGGGYWGFINALRRRWGANGPTMERPMFWGYARQSGSTDPVELLRASLGNLGPIIAVLGPWQRLEPDARVVRSGLYPKLPPEAPQTLGKCPDLDVDAFLTFKHREAYWDSLLAETRALRAAVPGIKVIQMTHPAMECIYRPLEAKWPIAADGVKTSTGETFGADNYSQAWVGDEMMAKDWAVLYYVPRPGSAQMQAYIASAERALDEGKLDGMYSDEFSWAFTGRAYSRYDYSRWDDFSADLDETGKVVALKADAGKVTEACQTALLQACLSRGKFFLGNGGSCLRSIQNLPQQRFIEGGNGPTWAGQGHLSAVPLILGNMGDEKTTAGVFASVRQCLTYGSIYSPTAVNLLLRGADNFVSKLYPITVVELGPGFVIGRERVITTVSRSFAWPGGAAAVTFYRYDKAGTRLPAEADLALAAGQPLAVQVPEGGLVIAEAK
jgi:hypothetical protein